MLTPRDTEKLRSIDSIEALIRFLKTDLDWPLASGDVEDVTFGYDPEELGLKPEHLPKINKIFQVRPLAKDQPWGIFFIDFENKNLPVTLMRRILHHLTVSRRRVGTAWNAGDLLFMTTYGEQVEGMREVAFAHFQQKEGELPTLRVLDWHARDTLAALSSTYQTLRNNLGWPPENSTAEEWRSQWSRPFQHGIGHSIKTSKALAEALASLSRRIRRSVKEVLEAETERGPMTKLYKAFKDALLHDLESDKFADTFAQTISYGLLIAAFARTPEEGSGHGTSMRSEDAPAMVPITNPFLREVLETFLYVGGKNKAGIDFDEIGIQDVVDLLNDSNTDINAIKNDFGNRKPGEDPVVHFYEDYLAAYDKPEKKKRGVFYTPQPVVSYIVRSVNELLQTEFGIDDGLASTITWGEMSAKNPEIKIPESTKPDDPFVVILDPATGTATFLVEVIEVIWRHLQRKWEVDRDGCISLLRNPESKIENPKLFQDFWNAYVPDHLLPRLYGYELMMAPYAIAHMKVGLKLGETDYRFGSSQRVRIYLTNALEPASELQARLALDWEALAHEAMAVKAVKETQRFTVVIGNPPYSGVSANSSETAIRLVDAYKFVDGVPLGERKHWLQDDYKKFMRISQNVIHEAGAGVLGFITNHGYLDDPTARGMRRSLMQSFHSIHLLDAHGSLKKREVCPDGTTDKNLFEIEPGVAIGLFRRLAPNRVAGGIRHADLWGLEEVKYRFLSSHSVKSTRWTVLEPAPRFFLFAPSDVSLGSEYDRWTKISDVFDIGSVGCVTARDGLTIHWNAEDVWKTVTDLVSLSVESARSTYDLGKDARDWTVKGAQEDVRSSGPKKDFIAPLLYRPFDERFTYYTGKSRGFIGQPQPKVARHFLGRENLGLSVGRQGQAATAEQWDVAFCTGQFTEFNLFRRGGNSLSPLYAYSGVHRHPNLSPAFLEALAGAIGRRFESGGSSSTQGGLFAEGDPLVAPNQSTLDDFGGGLSPVQGSLVTAPDPALNPVGPAFSPEDVFHYIYAVLHSPGYRSRYAEFLKIDFPRIPLPVSPEVFDALVPLGAELVALHLMESPRLDSPMTTFLESKSLLGEARVEKVSYEAATVWIDKAQTTGFQGVPEAVWNFHIGGYQVCEKWLKDRGPKGKYKDENGKEVRKPGRILSLEDIGHYQKIVVALSETIRIMREIDEAIDAHGGWPGAFKGVAT